VGTLLKTWIETGLGWPLAVLVAVLAAGCGSGGGSSAAPAPGPPAPPQASVTISGKVTYDFVPFTAAGGLNYPATDSNRPVRLATVQFVDGGNSVVAVTRTDVSGDYSLVVDSNLSGFIRVRAESIEPNTPSWFFRVVDNTASDAIYTLDGAMQSSGTANSQRDLHAPSGWTGSGYGNPRAAAPFAILDTILIGKDLALSADPAIDFPGLDIHWSENNVPSYDADGDFDPDTGEIGTSQFRLSQGLFLLGAEDNDTEEYDRHVVLHEFGHYLEFRMARSDSIGGPHALGDRVDMRVAYSEGLATALAAIALDNPVYKDSAGSGQAGAFTFSVENAFGGAARGWYSELSVHELIYDLVDTANGIGDRNDAFSYPFGTVWDAMTGPVATSTAVTSIFPFLNAVKTANAGDGPLLDLFAASQAIGPVSTDFGDNETNDAGDTSDVLPIYTLLTVNDPTPVNVCSIDAFTSTASGSSNKLSSRRFVRFTPPAAGNVTISVIATTIPADQFADPDFYIHRQGVIAAGIGPPSPACEEFGVPGWVEANCEEVATIFLPSEAHVLEVEEWSNTNESDDPDYPPIGRTCFDVTVTQP
jgi:hypothetical protein